jgi:hypothetical protein
MSNGTEKMFRKFRIDEAVALIAKHYELTAEEVKSTLKNKREGDEWNSAG